MQHVVLQWRNLQKHDTKNTISVPRKLGFLHHDNLSKHLQNKKNNHGELTSQPRPQGSHTLSQENQQLIE